MSWVRRNMVHRGREVPNPNSINQSINQDATFIQFSVTWFPSYMQRKQLFAVSRPQLNAYGSAWAQLSTNTSCVSSDVLYNLSKSAVCINWRASSGNGDYNSNHRRYIKHNECFPIKPVYTGQSPTVPPNEYRNCNTLLRWTGLSRFNCLVLPHRKMLQVKVLEHTLHMYTHRHTHIYIKQI
jgi:hypothetical protein